MSDVRLVAYQGTWPAQYAQVRDDIQSAVRAPGVVLEHIGSTAVPGLCAKLVLGGTLWRQHLHLRDALRQDPALRQAYADLKTRLAHQHASDKSAYTDAKAPFIRQVLAAHGSPAP